MEPISFVIKGKPVGKQETRFNRSLGHAYKPSETRNYAKLVSLTASAYMKKNSLKPLEGAVKLTMVIDMRGEKVAVTIEKLDEVGKKIPKPDSSNVLKVIEDALQGICFKNDKDILEHHVFKVI